MRPRTKITIPNPSTEFENFDRFARIVVAKGKPVKETKPEGKRIRPKSAPKE